VATAESRGRVLVDSDVVIDHIRGKHPLPDFPLAFSVITRCELFAGRDDPQYLRKLLAPMHEIPLDSSIAERGGELKRTVQLQTPDALIAATALEHELSLMTRNRRHFDRVPGLMLRHPRDPAKPTDDADSARADR
jgi:predicted nucleic acid-binding protein